MKMKGIISCLFLALLLISCKEKYEPPIITSNLDYLVVDGFLNNSADTTTLRLSRTKKLSDGIDYTGESDALIQLEDGNGHVIHTFQQSGNGYYFVPGMSLDLNSKYRLKINTVNGKQYVSDEITVKDTPPIDSISWQKEPRELIISVNTHDPQNNTRYYRWEYEETWEYHSAYFSVIKWENGIVARQPEEWVFACWQSQPSTNLLLGSTAKLATDNIYHEPIRRIPNNAVELSVKYSIFVRQFALTKQAYEYLDNLKKITEMTGSFFDAQPSQLIGNIHCVNNASELVIGYVTASTAQTQRVFIDNSQVRPWDFNLGCDPKFEVPPDSIRFYFGSGAYIPVEQYRDPRTGATITSGSTPRCADCLTRGGINVKPAFWP